MITTPVLTDPWLQAYCDPQAAPVFYSIASPNEVWKWDPFDVESIHEEARTFFSLLVDRLRQQPPPPRGAILVLLGESGSGKTHLLRAFRNYVHTRQIGYTAYMQMSNQSSNYARYLLEYLVDNLERPYDPHQPNSSRTALDRLSTALVESIPSLTAEERDNLREGGTHQQVDHDLLAELITEYADRLKALERFYKCDLDLIRVLFYCYVEDHRIRNRALKWLRCQPLSPADQKWIGCMVPHIDEIAPQRVITALAQIIAAVEQVPLIFMLDQLEDMQNLQEPEKHFRQLIDVITTLCEQAPNILVVLACLEDYYEKYNQLLPRSKVDRLRHDREPCRLTAQRNEQEIEQIVAKRLAYLYEQKNLPHPPTSLHPFQQSDFAKLGNLRTRDVLHHLHQHQQACIRQGHWSPFPLSTKNSIIDPPPPPPTPPPLETLWQEFLPNYKADVPEEDEEIAQLLGRIVAACSHEQSNGVHFGRPQVSGRHVEVEIHKPGNCVEKLLVAVCNRKPHGGGLLRQLEETRKRADNIPVALVRNSAFPKTGQTLPIIADLLKKGGRRIQIQEADLRTMLAFESFRQQHSAKNPQAFAEWQKRCQPLCQLPALQELLKLEELSSHPGTNGPGTSPSRTNDSSSQEKNPTVTPLPPPLPPIPPRDTSATLYVGVNQDIQKQDVHLDPALLVQHAAFLGGSGSGKTTAALNLIDQLLLRGIPAILIDRKGDLSCYADPHIWNQSPTEPQQQQLREQLRQKVDVALYTPGTGNREGRHLALPLLPSDLSQLSESEWETLTKHTAAALGTMLGLKNTDNDQTKQAILTKAIELLARRHAPRQVTIPALRELIRSQDDELIAQLGDVYRPQHYTHLVEKLQTLWLQHASLFEGPHFLDIERLLEPTSSTPPRTRLTIICTRFLVSDTARDFWVAQFLIALGRWCGRRPSSQLQAVVMLDEADVYLPATGRIPATKAPLENLLRRARSAGLSLFLATQSPGDFDYRCRENITTWFIGRIREERAQQKIKPMFEAYRRTDALDRLAGLKSGEFYLLEPAGKIRFLSARRNVISIEQLSEERILELASQQQ